eukprot:4002887-Prymnesium_polylepis.1
MDLPMRPLAVLVGAGAVRLLPIAFVPRLGTVCPGWLLRPVRRRGRWRRWGGRRDPRKTRAGTGSNPPAKKPAWAGPAADALLCALRVCGSLRPPQHRQRRRKPHTCPRQASRRGRAS